MRNRRALAQGQYRSSMPENMPSDEYLNQFELNTVSAQSLFWARSYIWQFSDFANLNGNDMENNQHLLDAIDEEQNVTDDVNQRCIQNYYHYMNPTLGAIACACCGRLDIPIDNHYIQNYRNNNYSIRPPTTILNFRTYNIHDPLLLPLHYSPEENNYYDSDVPHNDIENTPQIEIDGTDTNK